MPTSTSKGHRRGAGLLEEKNRKGKLLSEKASSFHGRNPVAMDVAAKKLHRPRTVPDLLSGRSLVQSPSRSLEERPKLTKLLLNVTIHGSVGAVQVVMTPESTVRELIATALRQYVKEGRRPILSTADPSCFDLHYSQFSLESLDREEKLMALGSRNFFLCRKKKEQEAAAAAGGDAGSSGGDCATTSSGSCSNEAEKPTKTGFNWLKFMDFLL